VYSPAADPPTTIISWFFRFEREISFDSPTLLNLSRFSPGDLPAHPAQAASRHYKKPARIARAHVGADNRAALKYSESGVLGKRYAPERVGDMEMPSCGISFFVTLF
jgi:hypothetical protein